MRSVHSVSRKVFVLFAVICSESLVGCSPITNSDLSDHIREFSSKNDNINSTGIKTLQKEDPGGYANFSPARNPVRFKDVSDSTLSSSSYSRGLLHHEHPGYTVHDYEESPPIYGYEYHVQGSGPHHHVNDHHVPDYHHGPYGHHGHPEHHEYHGHHGGHHELNYHHKHYDHALAAKAFLWPIAGIALLGAAAALVSNPVLLQLGVVSGRRKRRETEEIYDPQLNTDLNWLKKKNEELIPEHSKVIGRLTKKNEKNPLDAIRVMYNGKFYNDDIKQRIPMKKSSVKQEALFKKLRSLPTVQSPGGVTTDVPGQLPRSKIVNEDSLVSVPLILKENV